MAEIHASLRAGLEQLLKRNGQDLFLKVGSVPRVRAGGGVHPLSLPVITDADVKAITQSILHFNQQILLGERKSVDFAFSLPDSPQRFRGNIFFQQGTYSIVIRRLWRTIPSFEELNIPPALKKIALERSGIILLAGTVASGKTTTINAMIDMMNQTVERHIVTIEDPVEYLHQDKKCIINQREIGQDADDYISALKYVVRQSPDVIMIGEMRDKESFNFALNASEVGRLVISTVHAKSAVQIMDRLLGFFPSEKRDTVIDHLSHHVTCFAVEKLLVNKKDNDNLVPAFEILIGNPVIKNLIREKDFDKIPQAMRNFNQDGMQTMDQSLFKLWKDGFISTEDALSASEKPHDLEQNMRGISIDSHNVRILGA